MQATFQPLSLIFNLNERLFINALEGLTDEQTAERLTGHNNPISWIAAHTVSSRYFTLMCLGKPDVDPYYEMFENFRGYDAAIPYPSLSEVKAEWKKVSALLRDAMEAVTAEYLAAESILKNPTGDFSNSGTLAFLAQHESYDIGQIAYLKKYHTKEAMKY